MRPLLVLVSLLAGCAAPVSHSVGNFEHDFYVPASNGLGKQEQALDSGDGPDGRLLLFLNFDGANILRVANDTVSENSADDASWIPDTYAQGQSKAYAAFDTSPYTSFGFTDATAKQFIVDQVTSWYAPFNVAVVSTRPASGRYTELMVGDQTSDFISAGSGTVGVSTLDCGNESEVNVGFDFAVQLVSNAPISSQSDAQVVLLAVAQTAAHEAGHTFGLEHVNDPQDIMDPTVSSDVVGFIDSANVLSEGSSSCSSGDTTENTHQRLIDNVGAAPVGASDLAVVGPSQDLATTSTTVADLSSGGVGAACTDSSQCGSGVCATGNGTQFCTVACSDDTACPASFTCDAISGGAKYCVPKKHASGCSYGDAAPSGGVLLCFLLLLVCGRASARRSSRPSAT